VVGRTEHASRQRHRAGQKRSWSAPSAAADVRPLTLTSHRADKRRVGQSFGVGPSRRRWPSGSYSAEVRRQYSDVPPEQLPLVVGGVVDAVVAREVLPQAVAVCEIVPAALGACIGDVAALMAALTDERARARLDLNAGPR